MARVENLCLLAGSNDWEKGEALRELKRRLFPEGAAPTDDRLFEGRDKEIDPETILSELLTLPLVSRHRLIHIRDIEETPPTFQSRFLKIAARLPKETVCVLETKETVLRGSFFEKLSSLGKVSVFKEPRGGALLSWLSERALFYGKRITSGAQSRLLEREGTDLSRLDRALEMLATYVGERTTIDVLEVERLMAPSLTRSSFELARAVAAREALAALGILAQLFSEKERPHEIVGAVGWQLRRMLRAKELLEEGLSPAEVGRHLRLRWEEERFLELLSRFERPELEKGLRALLEVDQRLKTGMGEGKGELESFILALCR